MAWTVELDPAAARELEKLDPQQARRILTYLAEHIATDEDPRRFGDPLRKNLTGFWKYRIGDYRVVCDIQDNKVLVLVLRVGHRSRVYGGH